MHPELPSRLFDDWWRHEGSGMPPLPGEDTEAHVRRICRFAWLEAADWAQGEVRTALAQPPSEEELMTPKPPIASLEPLKGKYYGTVINIRAGLLQHSDR